MEVVPLLVGFRHKHINLPPHRFAGGTSEHALGGGIKTLDLSVFIDGDDRIGGGGEKRAVHCLALAQRFLGPLAIADIEHHGQDMIDRALRIPDRHFGGHPCRWAGSNIVLHFVEWNRLAGHEDLGVLLRDGVGKGHT